MDRPDLRLDPALRVGFAGTPEFAAVALQALLAAGAQVPLVLSQPDRPAGRGMKLQASPVKQVALEAGLPVAQPRSLRLDGRWPEEAGLGRAALEAARLDVLVVAAYGLILPAWVLEMPRLGCVNIHASLLPRWRGAAPIHRAIEAGDAETGITLMQMDEGLDTGAMIAEVREPIGPHDTTAGLHDRLAALGGRMVVEALAAAGAVRWPSVAQPQAGVCYAHKIEKAEAAIDWAADAVAIERRVRAFDPFPGASFVWAGEVVKVWQAVVRPELKGAPGEVLQAEGGTLCIACGHGALQVLQVQRPGGKRVPVAALLQARPVAPGALLAAGD